MMMTDMSGAFDSVLRCPHIDSSVGIQWGAGMAPWPSPHCSNHTGPLSGCHCSNLALGSQGSCMFLCSALEEQQSPVL